MTTFKKLKYWFPLSVSVALAAGILLGYYLRGLDTSQPGQKKFLDILELIDECYVDEVDLDSLVENTIPAMLRNLDPHSAYIPAKDLDDANLLLKGSFGGIGIQFQVYRDTINVVEVIEGGPSEKAGILPGDRIIAVNGKPVTNINITDADVRDKLRGEIGTTVNVTVSRPSEGNKHLKFNLVRDNIPVQSIDAAYLVEDNIGLIKVSSFSESTYLDFQQAMLALAAEGAENFIIDLRGNTGGYMETAIMMANEFLPADKEIVRTRGRMYPEETVLTDGRGAFMDARVVILIDEMSASSSEIFAGALQDNDRALILGRRSFGKGLVQKPFRFDDGSELRLTIQRYFTPSGRSIQKDYKSGNIEDYEYEIYERYKHGEGLNADSIKFDKSLMFKTSTGRTVYGGGGIMPDVFVPNDTSGVTNYYIDVANAGLLQKFAYEYCDLNRSTLSDVETVKQLLKELPSDDILLSSFVYYATTQGIPARWYYIKLSRQLIVSQLKALIARNTLGIPAYHKVMNMSDVNVLRAIESIHKGKADFPIEASAEHK